MKQCIICGNVGADDSTTCEVCGNPYLDVDEEGNVAAVEAEQDISDMDEIEQEESVPDVDLPEQSMDMFGEPEPEIDEAAVAVPEMFFEEEPDDGKTESGEDLLAGWDQKVTEKRESVPEAEAPAPERKMKSGPHIYGQEDINGHSRSQSGPAGRPASGTRSPGARPENGPGAPVRRPANGQGASVRQPGSSQGAPAKQSANGQGAPVRQPGNVQGAPVRRPANDPGDPAKQRAREAAPGRPENVQGRAPQRQPVNGTRDGMGRPVNGQRGYSGQPGAVQGSRPVNMQGQAGRPMNSQGRPTAGPAPRPMNGPAGRPGNMPGKPANMGASYRAAKIRETSRGMLKSPVFLLVALLNTIYLASSIGAIFLKELNFSQVIRLISGIQLPTQVTGYMDKLLDLMAKLDTDAIAVNLVLQIPNLLLCLGLWMIFLAGRSKKEEIPGGGFLLAKIYLIIGLIKYSIIMLAGLVISVALLVSAWASGVGSMKVAAVMTLILMVVITMMMVMYYFAYMGTLKTCKVNAGIGESYGKASAYVAVAHVFFGLLAVINLLSGIVNGEISGIIGGVSKMGWMILFAVWIFMYRGNMSEVEE